MATSARSPRPVGNARRSAWPGASPSLRIPNHPLGIVGVYDVADDWIPIYDRTDLDGFYVAIGTSGNQFKNAPFAAHAMAELIVAVEDGHDHEAEPISVKGPYTGAEFDLGSSRATARSTSTARSRSTADPDATVHPEKRSP